MVCQVNIDFMEFMADRMANFLHRTISQMKPPAQTDTPDLEPVLAAADDSYF
jgi:hypothetical protein